ncbi:ATP-binding protein [Candidatus Auribacterota bacterium]
METAMQNDCWFDITGKEAKPDDFELLYERETAAMFQEVDALDKHVRDILIEKKVQVDHFEVQLLLREAFLNAVAHGSKSNPQKKIRCKLFYNKESIAIEVDDMGAGFDWKTKIAQTPVEPDAVSGRGLFIMRECAEAIYFNEKGNRIFLKKNQKKTFEEQLLA